MAGEGKGFFFEKKKQKTFATAPAAWRILRRPCAAPESKSFLVLFFKKGLLALGLSYISI